jgi:hypothetical protein
MDLPSPSPFLDPSNPAFVAALAAYDPLDSY